MPFPIVSTTLQAASAAASGNAVVTDADKYVIHRFYVTISAAATVRAQASQDGTNWFNLTAAALTSTDMIIIDRPFKNLRINWASNTGNVTVLLEQLGMAPTGML